jgi:hypothetical protein
MKSLALALLLFSGAALAGTNNLPVETGNIIQRQHVNKFQTALAGDLVPRDSSGNVGDVTADLGESVYRWKNIWAKAVQLLGSFGGNPIQLQAPSSVPSPYPMTLPSALPSARKFVMLDNSGSLMTFDWTRQAITATGANTVTVPAGVTQLDFEIVGGGAGGGAGGGGTTGLGNGSGGGAGGSSGQRLRKKIQVTPGTVVTINVGAGGAGGTGGFWRRAGRIRRQRHDGRHLRSYSRAGSRRGARERRIYAEPRRRCSSGFGRYAWIRASGRRRTRRERRERKLGYERERVGGFRRYRVVRGGRPRCGRRKWIRGKRRRRAGAGGWLDESVSATNGSDGANGPTFNGKGGGGGAGYGAGGGGGGGGTGAAGAGGSGGAGKQGIAVLTYL